jgi:4-amino-4-deoxy-L-arabinose transferase-like glycosyltransferase
MLLRLGLVVLPLRNPEGGILVDSVKYIALSSSLVTTGRYAESTDQDTIWPPGYPLFVAAASGWSDPSPTGVALAQLGLTCVTGVLVVALTSRLASSEAGQTAGWLYALSPAAALWALTVMSETLFAALLVASSLVGWRRSGEGVWPGEWHVASSWE